MPRPRDRRAGHDLATELLSRAVLFRLLQSRTEVLTLGSGSEINSRIPQTMLFGDHDCLSAHLCPRHTSDHLQVPTLMSGVHTPYFEHVHNCVYFSDVPCFQQILKGLHD